MSSTAKARIKFKRDTTSNWNNARGMIPLEGEIIVYNDYQQIVKVVDNVETVVQVPGIKIGDGRAYVQDLPFVDEELRKTIMDHITNQDIHVTLNEKLAWWNKLNVDDDSEIIDGALIFNRD